MLTIRQRDAVAALYPSQLVDASSPQFAKAQESFWNALQRENAPACFFQPTNAKEVSKALVEVIRANAPFAIKGGGHSSNIEGSSIHNGFQFDLCKLNHVRIAEDRQTVDVGPGQRWGAFYEELEKEGLIAVGGRDAGVGVPGFIFGGQFFLMSRSLVASTLLTRSICRWSVLLFQRSWLGYRQPCLCRYGTG